MLAGNTHTVSLLEHDKLPKFVGRVPYFKIEATRSQYTKVQSLRKLVRKYNLPNKAECKELCESIDGRMLSGELTNGDSPLKRARAITDVIGYKYPGLSGLIVSIAKILEER